MSLSQSVNLLFISALLEHCRAVLDKDKDKVKVKVKDKDKGKVMTKTKKALGVI